MYTGLRTGLVRHLANEACLYALSLAVSTLCVAQGFASGKAIG